MFINTTFFDFSSWRSSAIWDFLKFEISTAGPVWRANMHHHAECCADRSNRCRDIAIFKFFRMVSSANLDFLKFVTVRTVKRVELHHRAKFRQNR